MPDTPTDATRESAARPKWQPDPRTIEWVAKQLEWELQRQDTRGPATSANSVPAWLRRVKKDKKRLREAR